MNAPRPHVQRIRHTLKMRDLTVQHVQRLSPHMIRVTFTSDDLNDFVSLSPDDHIKLFFTDADGAPARRDYTPRRFDTAARTLVIDFVDHPGGPATAWAQSAAVGQTLQIGGPRGSMVTHNPAQRWLLIGDEAALPAIGRRIEEASPEAQITAIVSVPGPEDEQTLRTRATLDCRWIHRPLSKAHEADAVIAALGEVDISADTFVWIAGETHMVRAVRAHLLTARGIDKDWVKAAGYWKQGDADTKETL